MVDKIEEPKSREDLKAVFESLIRPEVTMEDNVEAVAGYVDNFLRNISGSGANPDEMDEQIKYLCNAATSFLTKLFNELDEPIAKLFMQRIVADRPRAIVYLRDLFYQALLANAYAKKETKIEDASITGDTAVEAGVARVLGEGENSIGEFSNGGGCLFGKV